VPVPEPVNSVVSGMKKLGFVLLLVTAIGIVLVFVQTLPS